MTLVFSLLAIVALLAAPSGACQPVGEHAMDVTEPKLGRCHWIQADVVQQSGDEGEQ